MKRGSVFTAILFVPGSLLFGLLIGSTSVSLLKAVSGLFSSNPSREALEAAQVIVVYRLPLVVQAFLCGGMLAVAGCAMQAVLRNPLAEPFVLGVSSGGAFGLVIAGLFGVSSAFWARSLFAFGFGMLALLVVFVAAIRRQSHFSLTGVILAGIISSAFFSAATMVVQSLLSPYALKSSIALLMGHFTLVSWGNILLTMLPALAALLLLVYKSPELDLLSLGGSEARSLGVEENKNIVLVLVAASLLTATTVSLCGVVGFIGLVAPHAARMLLGYSHRKLLPAAFLAGGVFLTIAHTLSRSLLASTEIPVGVVTAVLGAPFFLFILRRYGRTYG